MKVPQRIFELFVIFLLTLLLLPIVIANPPLPMSLYGSVVSYNAPASVGTKINFIDNRGQICGSYDVAYSGKFGLLNCKSYNATGDEKGALQGEPIFVRVNGLPGIVIFDNDVTTLNTLTWDSGVFKNITIIRPSLVCGDGFCDLYESCSSCEDDCGSCSRPPGSGGSSGDSGSGSDGSSDDSSGGASGGVGAIGGAVGVSPPAPPKEECAEDWTCSDWGPCQNISLQTRECVDLNECGTEVVKPDTTQICEYIEPEVDFPTNDSFDPTETELDFPIRVTECSDRLPFLSFPSLTFIFLMVVLVLLRSYFDKRYLRRISKDKSISEVALLKKKLVASHKKLLFIVTTLVISLVVYFYHYFFYMCPESYYNNVFLLVLFIILFPFLIQVILFLLGSTGKNIKRKLALLEDSHYRHILRLLSIANDTLMKSEDEITAQFKELKDNAEFNELTDKFNPLLRIFSDFKKLKGLYKDGKLATSVEKDLLENIKNLLEDEEFTKKLDEIQGLRKLANSLSSLYDSYESKQDLYYEMLKIESGGIEGSASTEALSEDSEGKNSDNSNFDSNNSGGDYVGGNGKNSENVDSGDDNSDYDNLDGDISDDINSDDSKLNNSNYDDGALDSVDSNESDEVKDSGKGGVENASSK